LYIEAMIIALIYKSCIASYFTLYLDFVVDSNYMICLFSYQVQSNTC